MAAKKGPPSAVDKGEPVTAATPEGATDKDSKGINYAVQVHTEDKGLEVKYVTAESGDEAAQKVLASKDYNRASIRGVTPASDPDANSLGGERDANIMLDNAENGPDKIDPMGTEANRKATEELGKADLTELKD